MNDATSITFSLLHGVTLNNIHGLHGKLSLKQFLNNAIL